MGDYSGPQALAQALAMVLFDVSLDLAFMCLLVFPNSSPTVQRPQLLTLYTLLWLLLLHLAPSTSRTPARHPCMQSSSDCSIVSNFEN